MIFERDEGVMSTNSISTNINSTNLDQTFARCKLQVPLSDFGRIYRVIEMAITSPDRIDSEIDRARDFLVKGELDQASKSARKALKLLDGRDDIREGGAVMLSAEISVEQGDFEEARSLFLRAVVLDPDGDKPEHYGGGAEKFLWLAQLEEEGGEESVKWFEKGAAILRKQLATMAQEDFDDRKKKLAGALCGIIEIYMTDLSWAEDAEDVCERHIAEAYMIAPEEPETLQTLANVRISQGRVEEARNALSDSLAVWSELPPEDPSIPAFPVRISLSRLLLEVEMEEEALHVLERLVNEDDQSVEAWYLGGWCMHLLASKPAFDGESTPAAMAASREWLRQSLNLYQALDYEDDRLKSHAEELVAEIGKVIGPEVSEEEEQAHDTEYSEDESDESEGEDAGENHERLNGASRRGRSGGGAEDTDVVMAGT